MQSQTPMHNSPKTELPKETKHNTQTSPGGGVRGGGIGPRRPPEQSRKPPDSQILSTQSLKWLRRGLARIASSLQRHHLEWTHTQQAVACGSHATHGKGRHAATHVVVAFPGTLHRKVGVDGRQAGVLAVAMTTAGMAADFNRPQRIPDGDC